MLHVHGDEDATAICKIQNDSGNADADILILENDFVGHPGNANNYIGFRDDGDKIDEMDGDAAGGVRFTGEAEDTYSDSRVKKDITDLGSVLDKINALKPKTFKYTDEFLDQSFQDYTIKDWQRNTQTGFIAQEIGAIFPEIVLEGERTVQKDNVSYDGKTYNTGDTVKIQEIGWGRKGNSLLVAHLVKAIQELSAKVTALENA